MKKVPITEDPVGDAASVPGKPTASPTETDDQDEVASMQADLDRFRDLAMRTQADFENYKKRCAREKDESIKYANKSLLEKLVSIVDHFELGLEAARGEGEKSPPIDSRKKTSYDQIQDLQRGSDSVADVRNAGIRTGCHPGARCVRVLLPQQ